MAFTPPSSLSNCLQASGSSTFQAYTLCLRPQRLYVVCPRGRAVRSCAFVQRPGR
jgi:hypothetical protein